MVVPEQGLVLGPDCLDLVSFKKVITADEARENCLTLLCQVKKERFEVCDLSMLVTLRTQDRNPCEVRVELVLRVYDLLLVLAGGHEPILVWHQVLLLVVQICWEFGRVEDVKGDDVGQSSPLLVNWTVPRQVNALEAWELVFLVLIHA